MSGKKYAFVDMEDGDMGPAKIEKTKKKHSSRKHRDERSPRRDRHEQPHKSRSIRQRLSNDDDRWGDEEEYEEEEPEFQESAPKRVKTSHSDDDISEEEKERRKDQAERDAFTKRLLERDQQKDKSKTIVTDSAMAQRRALADDAKKRAEAMPDIRLKSRQDYLRKREAERLALLRAQVQQETEELRSGVSLSQKELADFAKNREVLRLAEERNRIDDHLEGYALPADYFAKGKHDVLNQRIVEDRDEYGNARHVTDHELWEKEQEKMAKNQIHSRSREAGDEGVGNEVAEYDYILDPDQGIKWVMDSKLPGRGMDTEQRQLLARLDAAEKKQLSIEETRKSLPIYKYRDDFLQAVKDHQILVIVGETGSGKTTQIPQFLNEAGYGAHGKIACTQPRRVAAMSVATRVAEEMGVKLGQEVGYAIRFENNTSDKTVIEYLTDGTMLKNITSDPELSSFSCVMIDEAHERTVHSDILLALLKDLALARPQLRILLSSATISSSSFSKYFGDCPTYNIEGRTFPVDIHYTPAPEANYLAAAVTTVFQIHTSMPTMDANGRAQDILVFLTGQEEIEAAETQIQEIYKKLGSRVSPLIVCTVFANLPQEQQLKIFEPTPRNARKVTLSTNIAETSLTLDSVVYVVDSGFVKENSFNPATGMSRLVTVPCSRASASQRSGRAGRTAPGKCFRLYTKYAFMNEMPEITTPEIQRTNLNGVVLLLKAMGVNDILNFDFMDAPAAETLIAALNQLYALAALNDRGELTKIGRQMAELPIDVPLAASILASGRLGCSEEIISICAMLPESGSLWVRPRDQRIVADAARARFTIPESDHLTLLNVFNSWVDSDFSPIFAKENFLQQRSLIRARDVRDQLAKLCERVEVTMSSCGIADQVPIQKAITAGFFQNAARLQRGGDSYRVLKGNQAVYIHPSSVLMAQEPSPKLILFHELTETTKEYMRNCMTIKAEWLSEAAPHYHKKKELEQMEEKKVPKDRR